MNRFNHEIPYWYNLLDYWVNNQENSGLTLPFLIGAQSRFIKEFTPNNFNIKELIDSIVTAPIYTHCVTLKFCRTIEAYILGLVNRIELDTPYFVNHQGIPTLAIIEGAFKADSTIEEITTFLESLYLPIIFAGHYSRQRSAFGGWSTFTEEDIEQIKKSLPEFEIM